MCVCAALSIGMSLDCGIVKHTTYSSTCLYALTPEVYRQRFRLSVETVN